MASEAISILIVTEHMALGEAPILWLLSPRLLDALTETPGEAVVDFLTSRS